MNQATQISNLAYWLINQVTNWQSAYELVKVGKYLNVRLLILGLQLAQE